MPVRLSVGIAASLLAALAVSGDVGAHKLSGGAPGVALSSPEEFVGPFPSWANVKTIYGAVGNGVADDTTAIQNALNALGSSNPTIYFPAGTYRTTATLTLAGRISVNIIGQDPANTAIIWAGSSGGTMLAITGVAYSRFDRLTFNGQGNAAILVDQNWPGTGNYFDTGNQYADDVFENSTSIAFRCGLTAGCADTSMLRDKFISNSSGIWLGNFNALDMWVWYSLFQNNAVGVTNRLPTNGAGNFHVYNSVFQGSTSDDIDIGNTGLFTLRGNYSIGSNQFAHIGGSCTSDNITIQGNTILDPTQSEAIYFKDMGPYVVLDNTIRSLAPATGPVMNVHTGEAGCTGDLFSMGNTFTVASPVSNGSGGHSHEISDQVVARGTINPAAPTLPGTPPNNNRQIFEVTPGSTAAQIQLAINNAVASGTTRPVVHIQPGTYDIDTTLVVPAGSDVQIIGDGRYSQLTWNGASAGLVLQLQGPSKATLREFSVNGNVYSADGIEVTNADQAGSRVFMEGVALEASHRSIFVDALDYTNVELHDLQHISGDSAGTDTSLVVTGGSQALAGNWQGGATNVFNGLTADNYYSYDVSNGAHVAVNSVWNDLGAGASRSIANVTGASTFTYAGSLLTLATGASRSVTLNDFHGTAALVSLATTTNIDITGDGSGSLVLGLGLIGPAGFGGTTTFFSNTSSPSGTTEFLNGLTTFNPPPLQGASELPEQGCCDTAFLTSTLNQLRTTQPTVPLSLAGALTDVSLYRVYVYKPLTGIHLQH